MQSLPGSLKNSLGHKIKINGRTEQQVEAFVPKPPINKKLYESGKKSSDTSRHAAVLKSTARGPFGSAKWEKKSFSTEELNLQFPRKEARAGSMLSVHHCT